MDVCQGYRGRDTSGVCLHTKQDAASIVAGGKGKRKLTVSVSAQRMSDRFQKLHRAFEIRVHSDVGRPKEKGKGMWFKNRKIRQTEEAIAYYTGQCEILTAIVKAQHTSWDRDELVKARANQRKYEQRLLHLSHSSN